MKLGRREMLTAVAAATGGLVYSKGLSAMLADDKTSGHDHSTVPMMQRDAWTSQAVDVFSSEKRQLVAAIVETIIPKTDTPGAIDAGVPKFIELLYDQWMAPPERAVFDEGLAETDTRAQKEHRGKFAAIDAGAQKAVLEAMEEEQGDHPWFEFGGDTVAKSGGDAPFMALIKEITVTGFFMSEVGATQVLRASPMTGEFDGDFALSPDESSWASEPFM